MSSQNTCNISSTFSMEKCLTNIDLVTNICKFLNFKQQYQLLQVSRELKYIIQNCVWKRNCKEVEISQIKKDFILSDTLNTLAKKSYTMKTNNSIYMQTSNCYLKENEMENFLKLNEKNIKKLQLIAGEGFDCLVYVRNTILQQQQFQNLIHIGFFWITLSNKEELEKLAKNCKQLETLIFYKCLNNEQKRLMFNRDIDLEILKSLKNLKQFVIVDRFKKRPENSEYHNLANILDIFGEFKLVEIIINVDITFDRTNIHKKVFNKDNFKYCKSLSIGPFQDFYMAQGIFLQYFENLHKLNLRNIRIYASFFQILKNFCKNLKHLSFYECDFMQFEALTDLQKLSLKHCSNLSWQDLRISLNVMNLESFTSLHTNYKDNFIVFPFSNSLKKIKFYEGYNKNILKLFEFNRSRLHQLNEFHWDTSKRKFYRLHFLEQCENLKVLSCTLEQIKLQECFNMKFLEKLTITTKASMRATDVRLLLMLENLKELTIDMNFSCTRNVNVNDLLPFRTKLLYLNINWRILGILYNFILDLLELNRQLIVKCSLVPSCESLIKLVTLSKFPQRFKDINLCGMRIDCIDLRNNCPDTVELAKNVIETFEKYMRDIYIILS